MDSAQNLNQEMEKLEKRLPGFIGRLVRWLRDPAARWFRIPMAIVFILAGFVGFLPVLGFWMIPLGLALIALDVPFLQRPMAKLTAYINSKLEPRPSRAR
jgi:hypothetical protein